MESNVEIPRNHHLEITCRGAGTMALHMLTPMQGDLKSLSVENFNKMVLSFMEEGFADPIRVWEDPETANLMLLDGHQRLAVLSKLKAEYKWIIPQIPIDYVEAPNLAAAKKKLLRVFVSQYGRVDYQGLYEFSIDAGIQPMDLALMDIPHVNIPEFIEGFFPEPMGMTTTVSEHERTLGTANGTIDLQYKEGEDDVPEVEDETIAQIGQVWQLGEHRLLVGDSTDEAQVAQLMADLKADMVFSDPPYGVSYAGGHNEKKREGIANDELTGEDLTGLFSKALKNAMEFSHDHAAFYIWYSTSKSLEVFTAFSQLDLKIRAVLVWYKIKSGLGGFMAQYIQNFEPFIYAHKLKCSPQWHGPTDEKTVWELKRDGRNEFHPTQKPVELSERAIKNSSKVGDIVLDLFGGSGATLIAAQKQGRRCFMAEIDPVYADVIIRRWQTFTGETAVLLG